MARLSKIYIEREAERTIVADNSVFKMGKTFTNEELASDKIQGGIVGDIESAYYGDSTILPVPAQSALVNTYNEFTPIGIHSRRVPVAYREEMSDQTVASLITEVATQHANRLIDRACNRWLYDIAPTDSTRIIRTTGTTTRACNLKSTTSPAVVKRMLEDDFRLALNALDNDGFAVNEKTMCLLTTGFKWDMFEWANFTYAERTNIDTALRDGKVWEFMGVHFVERLHPVLGGNGVVYTSAGVPKFIKENSTYDTAGTAFASTDVGAAILFKPSAVRGGLGLFRSAMEQPTGVEGDTLIEASAYYAGGKARSDGKGIVAIVEAR